MTTIGTNSYTNHLCLQIVIIGAKCVRLGRTGRPVVSVLLFYKSYKTLTRKWCQCYMKSTMHFYGQIVNHPRLPPVDPTPPKIGWFVAMSWGNISEGVGRLLNNSRGLIWG